MKIANTKGFTLIEVLIVLAILGIVGAIASYNFQHYRYNADLRTMARELQSDIAKTKQDAVSRGVCYNMTISPHTVGNNYTIERGNVASCNTATFTVISPIKSPTSLGLDGAGLEISTPGHAGGITIVFETRGTIASAGEVDIVNRKGSQADITTTVTGKTNVTFNMQ